MADQDDVRRIALGLPETLEADGAFAFSVRNRGKEKGFAWAWNERVHPKRPRVPNPEVLAVRVAGRAAKEALLARGGPFFTEPHYNGFPAILVRLPEIDAEDLAVLLIEGWRCQAPAALVASFDADRA